MVAGASDVFEESEQRGVYRAIRERRDVRSGFLPEPLPEDLLLRLLEAAHNAPSVGLMQPWRFILIRDEEVRKAVHDIFTMANRKAAERYEGSRAELYRSLKLEGVLEAPQNLCVACDPASNQGHGLGRQSMPETAIYSAVCAIENLWLAARAEGVGVGWLSILDPDALKQLLGIPTSVVLVAYLCLGYVKGFEPRPELERLGWEQRMNLKNILRSEHYGCAYVPRDQSR